MNTNQKAENKLGEIFVTEKSNIWEYLKETTRQIRVHNIFYGVRTHNQDLTRLRDDICSMMRCPCAKCLNNT